jgi:hypothetical protein
MVCARFVWRCQVKEGVVVVGFYIEISKGLGIFFFFFSFARVSRKTWIQINDAQ